MTILLISSTVDPASKNIKKHILSHGKWEIIDSFDENPVYRKSEDKDVLIVTINDRKIYRENLDKEIKKKLNVEPSEAVFISRHTSKMGKPTLSVHPLGNYGNADFGGRSNNLVKSSPYLMTDLLRRMKSYAKKENLYHSICFEVTHHGPYMDIPVTFAEVGSNLQEWKKSEPANVIAMSIIDILTEKIYEKNIKDIPVLIGIGGGHYAPRFTDVAYSKNVAFGHMIPNYHINNGNISDEIIEKTIKATPGFTGVYIHKKGLKKSQVTYFKKWFDQKNIAVFSSKDLPNLP